MKKIVFDKEMVRAIIQGRKTRFTLPMEVQPLEDGREWSISELLATKKEEDKKFIGQFQWESGSDRGNYFPSPLLRGDLVLVHEGISIEESRPKLIIKIRSLVYGYRLQETTDEEAILEGIESFKAVPGDGPSDMVYKYYLKDEWVPSAKHSFETWWKSRYGVESWDKNPYVWSYSFDVIFNPVG